MNGFIISAVPLATCQGPGALGAGALTPILTTVTKEGGFIEIPIFTNSTRDIWDNQFQLRCMDVWNIETLLHLDQQRVWIRSLLPCSRRSRLTTEFWKFCNYVI